MSSILNRATSSGGIAWDWQDSQPFGNTTNDGSEKVETQWNVSDPADPYYVSKIYAAQFSLATDDGVSIDFAHGTLKDFAGNPLTFTRLKSLHVRVVSGGNTGPVLLTLDAAGGLCAETASPNMFNFDGDTCDSDSHAIENPIYPGGQFQGDNPKGWPINTTNEIIGISLLNSTGGSAVVNVVALGT
jgi:hypothetical protein